MIILSGELIQSKLHLAGPSPAKFLSREAEGVYSLLMDVDRYCPNVPGTIFVSKNIKRIKVSDIGQESDRVRVIIRKKLLESNHKNNVCGYVLVKDGWIRDEVMIVPVKEHLYSRIGGLIETDKLAPRKVLIAGQGSGGSPIAVGLVQSGLGNITLIDHDRLEIANIMRHVLGISDVGRFKTLAMADFLLNKNPFLNITTAERKVDWDNIEFMRGLVKGADLVICATGDRISKRILSKLCIQEGKVLIIAGAHRRANGGSILRITPGKSLCYQCLLQWFPEETQEEEISNPEQAEGLAYTDRPVPIEPGLATDVLPISTMVVKLAIQELLRGTETTLQSLDEDLVAALYLWANRREGQFENMKPLAFNIGSMSPLRWYGVKISRYPACAECSHDDFIRRMTGGNDTTELEEDARLFEGDHDEQ